STDVVAYLARRLLFACFLVFFVSSASLVLTRLAPGDFVTETLGIGATPQMIAAARARYGLDRSIGAQYRDWLGRAARFDFGRSLVYDRPVTDLVPERAINSATLTAAALLLATLVGLPLGVIPGSRRGGLVIGAIRGGSVLLLSMPPLLTSLFLVFAAARTGWVPIGGMRSLEGGVLDLARHM